MSHGDFHQLDQSEGIRWLVIGATQKWLVTFSKFSPEPGVGNFGDLGHTFLYQKTTKMASILSPLHSSVNLEFDKDEQLKLDVSHLEMPS
jgi:hypothetical protein